MVAGLIKSGEATVRKEIDRKGETAIECARRIAPDTEQVENPGERTTRPGKER